MSPVTRSYLIAVAVGGTIGVSLYAVPFVPWRVAVGTAFGLFVVTVLFVRSLIDPTFLDGSQHVAPHDPQEWRTILAPDGRCLQDLAPEGGERLRLRQPDETRDDIPAADLLVASRRAGVR
jgi:hypothetical protein